jgi:transposase
LLRVARSEVADETIARRHRDEHRTAAEIAADLGCSTSTVYYRLARLGIPRRPPQPRDSARPTDGDLRRLYSTQGLSLRQIATRFAVTAQAVHGWLLDAGIARRRPGAPTPAWTADDLVKRYQSGQSALQIADDLGCATARVYRALQAAGIARRRVEPALSRASLIDGLERGLSAPEIAAERGVSVACVCRALEREGLATARQTARKQRSQRRAARAHHPAGESPPT